MQIISELLPKLCSYLLSHLSMILTHMATTNWDKHHILSYCSKLIKQHTTQKVSYRCQIMYLYDTIEEFNVDSKSEYSALSSTRSQKKKLKQTTLNVKPLYVTQP